MNNKEKIKFAVVGSGHIGKRHAEMIQRDAEAELVAMCDVRSMEACDTAAYAVPHVHTIEELLNSGLDFDVVNICTPNGLHAEQAIAALKAGNHVVVEKPMGLT